MANKNLPLRGGWEGVPQHAGGRLGGGAVRSPNSTLHRPSHTLCALCVRFPHHSELITVLNCTSEPGILELTP
jgi:hypothetical protein